MACFDLKHRRFTMSSTLDQLSYMTMKMVLGVGLEPTTFWM